MDLKTVISAVLILFMIISAIWLKHRKQNRDN